MKRLMTIMTLLAALLPVNIRAQGSVNDLETDLRGRIGVEADYKIKKGMHLNIETEGRFSDNFGTFARVQAGVGMSYKLGRHFKASAGYLLIEKKNSSGVWKTNHRFYVDGNLSFKSGDWRFGIKERVQFTHRDVNNVYQNTRNLVASKTRFKVSFTGFRDFQPYAMLEARVVLNDPAFVHSSSQQYDSSGYYYWPISSTTYTDTYCNRFRGGLGLEWKINKKNSLDFYGLTDYCYDKNIDTNRKGTKLKSLTYDRTLALTAGVAYKFSF